MAKRHDTLSTHELAKLSQDDRMAVMKMCKEGELTIEEAVAKVKDQTKYTAVTMARGLKFNRQGAIKKNRGRLLFDIQVQKGEAFLLLYLKICEGRDLLAMNKRGTADPYVKLYLLPDAKKKHKKKTDVRKNTRNPHFEKATFTWEIRSGTDLDSLKLFISVWDKSAVKKNKFMGAMTMNIAELFEGDITSGWYRLLDQKKGEYQNVPVKSGKQSEADYKIPAADKPKLQAPSYDPLPLKQKVKKETKKSVVKASTPSQKPTVRVVKAPEKVNAESYNYLKVLGQGSFGKVMLAERRNGDGTKYAIKMLKKEAVVEEDDVDCTMTERRMLVLSSGCPFLTGLVATFQTPERLFFVMEFVDGGDLMFHIQNLKRFSLDQAQIYTAEICIGLWYLHANGVLYRDLKLDNVMLDHDGHIKIADFGMCKENIWGSAATTTFCGTPGYLAPEIIQEVPYGNSVDWWALGVLLYEMMVGDSPFEGDDEDELFDAILRAKIDYPSRLDPNSKKMIQLLLDRNPKTRLGCGKGGKEAIKSHPFFGKLNWAKVEARQIEPPFKPFDGDDSSDAAANFDPEFTEAPTRMTPCDPYAIGNIDQTVFNGFSFVAPVDVGDGSTGGADAEEAKESIYERRNVYEDHAWYRPDLAREQAAKELMGRPQGTFFVRESSTQPGCFAIAMVHDRNRVWNGLVTPSYTKEGDTLYKLFVKQKFSSLPELIDHYCANPVTTDNKGNKVKLVKPL